jgi:hypothetical protein
MKLPARGIPHLFKAWDALAAKIRAHHRVTVFLDFDGTLVPLRNMPDDVQLDLAVRSTLEALVCRANTVVTRPPHTALTAERMRRLSSG